MFSLISSIQGKNGVCEDSTSLDEQKVYSSLLDVYHDYISTKVSATKLCQELTLMKLDNKWRKSFESFLHFWAAKVQDLEGIEDSWLMMTLGTSG
jgi:hypothetical protein